MLQAVGQNDVQRGLSIILAIFMRA